MKGGSDRFMGPAFHADAALQLHHVLAQLRLAHQHFGGRIPIGPFLLAMDGRKPGPDETFRADPHAVANGLPTALDKAEKMTARINDDRARPFARRVGDDLAREGGIGAPRLFRWHSVNAGAGRPAYAGGKNQQHSARYTPHDPHLPARKTPEPEFHKNILNQNG